MGFTVLDSTSLHWDWRWTDLKMESVHHLYGFPLPAVKCRSRNWAYSHRYHFLAWRVAMKGFLVTSANRVTLYVNHVSAEWKLGKYFTGLFSKRRYKPHLFCPGSRVWGVSEVCSTALWFSGPRVTCVLSPRLVSHISSVDYRLLKINSTCHSCFIVLRRVGRREEHENNELIKL